MYITAIGFVELSQSQQISHTDSSSLATISHHIKEGIKCPTTMADPLRRNPESIHASGQSSLFFQAMLFNLAPLTNKSDTDYSLKGKGRDDVYCGAYVLFAVKRAMGDEFIHM